MIVELDIGNTRIKWRHTALHGDDESEEGVFDDVEEFFANYAQQKKPDVFRFCSVRDQAISNKLISWSSENWGFEPQVAEVSRECGGVTVNYADVSRLGVDRWLAMLAAYRKAGGACLVVDCGTAFTLDSLSAEGSHLGGFILPGLKLMQESLIANTGIRLDPGAHQDSIEMGNSTDEAVLNGSLASLVAIVEKHAEILAQQSGQTRVFVSGGDAQLLAKFVESVNCEIVPGLVLDGLAIACPGH